MAKRTITPGQPTVLWRFRAGLAATLAGLFVSLVLLLTSHAEPAVVNLYAAKVDSLAVDADGNGVVSPGDTILYVITITNSGDESATTASLGDSPDLNTALVVGSVQTSQGTVQFGNNPGDLNVYVDFGDIAAAASVTVSFQVLVNDPLTPGVVDVMNQGIVRCTEIPVLGTDDPDTASPNDPTVTSIVRDPALIVDKSLTDVETDIVYPNTLTFTIAITNVGLAVDVITLTDTYDPYYLSFVDAAPYPEEDANDGSLMWYDLTGTPPSGFGSNLSPGQSFSVTVVFTVAHDITVTVNTASVISATDEFGAPVSGSSSDATIIDVPTAAEVLYFRIDKVVGRKAHLAWATVTEIDNVGFRLYRAYESVRAQAEMVAYIPSQAHGGGATYTHIDTVPTGGLWWYWLVDVDTSGRETFQGAVRVVADERFPVLYLPLVLCETGYRYSP